MKKNICDSKMSFEDCELAILRSAVDKAEERQGKAVDRHRQMAWSGRASQTWR